MATSDGSKKRRTRRSRPAVEALEGRALMTAGLKTPALPPLSSGKEFDYSTRNGGHVTISLYGSGSLAGTSVDPDGALNLVISGTNELSGVIGKVHGGGGVAPLRSIEYGGGVSPDSLSGVGGTLLNIVNLKGFDLVSGGKINLTAGVHTLFLNSIADNTQVNVRELPESLSSSSAASTAITPASTMGLTVGTATYDMNGQTVTYRTAGSGVQTLVGISGQYVAGTNLPPVTNGDTANPLVQPAPLGVVVSVNDVNGPSRADSTLGDAQMFGYDQVTGQLIRFDIATGQPTLTINGIPQGTAAPSVSLAKDNGTPVVLVDNGQNVYAFDPDTGVPLGSFTLSGLAASGLTTPNRIGTADAATVVADPTAGGLGLIQPINLPQSLASGAVVPLGAAYASQNGFTLSGGLSGVNGSDTLYALGGATFDRYQPLQNFLGLTALNVNPTSGSPSESSRGAFTNNGNSLPSNAGGATPTSASNAVGSVGQSLAVDTGVTPASGTTPASNTVTLFNPVSLVSTGTFTLADANPLTALSAAFRPSLAGTAIVDIQGNVQSFRAQVARGLVLNDEGNLNLAKINTAVDSTIIGYPFGHAEIPNRQNVTILSSGRIVDDRNGVDVENITPGGPLSRP